MEDLGISTDAVTTSAEYSGDDQTDARLRRRRGLSASNAAGVFFGGERGGGVRRRVAPLEDDGSVFFGSDYSKFGFEDGAEDGAGWQQQQQRRVQVESEVTASFDAEVLANSSPAALQLQRASQRYRRRRLYQESDYDESVNTAADVFVMTAGAVALESALPSTLRVVSEGYVSTDDDNIELTVAVEDIAGLFERNSVGEVLRGAVLATGLTVDTYYTAAVSNLSPLLKLPVDAVQRGRDHGLPTYNAAREASLYCWKSKNLVALDIHKMLSLAKPCEHQPGAISVFSNWY